MCVLFYIYQTVGACAGICTCDRTQQMDKTASKRPLRNKKSPLQSLGRDTITVPTEPSAVFNKLSLKLQMIAELNAWKTLGCLFKQLLDIWLHFLQLKQCTTGL